MVAGYGGIRVLGGANPWSSFPCAKVTFSNLYELLLVFFLLKYECEVMITDCEVMIIECEWKHCRFDTGEARDRVTFSQDHVFKHPGDFLSNFKTRFHLFSIYTSLSYS